MSETPQGLRKLVDSYFKFRGYTEPNTTQAMMFLVSEIGELSDAIVHGQADWVRNNPEQKNGDIEAIKGEIADVLLMLTKLADTLGVDPLTCMIEKFMSKGWKE